MTCIDIEKFCLQEKILDKPLFEVTDFNTIVNLINTLSSNNVYKKFRSNYKHNLSKVSVVLKYYRDFLKTNAESLDSKEKVSAVKIENPAERIDSTKKAFREWLKIKYVSEMTASKYFDLAEKVNQMLKNKNLIASDLFLITDTEKLRSFKSELFGRISLVNLQFFTALDNFIEFRRKVSAAEKISAPPVKSEFNTEKIDKPAEISNNRSNAISIQQNSVAEKISAPLVKSKTPEVKNLSDIDKYAEILSKHFGEDGYKLGKIIHRNKFKNYFFEEYGENPADSAEQIEEFLKKIGTQRENRIFPNQDENQSKLLEVIVNDITAAFNSGASAVFVEAVYEKYKKPLAEELKIYNAESCAPLILQNANKKFFRYYAQYFTPRIRKADPISDIVNHLKEFYKPLSYNQMFQSLWYIPRNQIESLIKSQIPAIVCVANEMFFYAPNLPLDETELQKISSLIQAEIDFHGYITDIKLMELIKSTYPNIAMNLDGFNAYAVRKCLSYILGARFAFNGSVISAKGSQLNLGNVFAEFSREHETLTLEELKDFSRELDTTIYWNSVLNEMVRVSQNKFVRKDLIQFDVPATDNVLAELCPQNYSPLKEFTLFLSLPNAGYAWNIYLLESYLYSFSRKFRLIHSSFSESGVYGAMVRVGAPISDYDSLITDALSYSDSLTESKALQFIVDKGFQQRKAYKNIGDVIRNAKIIKDNRRKF